MVLEQQRAWADRFLLPAAHRANRMGLSPDAVTIVSFGFALAAAALLYLGASGSGLALAAGGLFVFGSAALDALDGRLARLQGTASPRGDYLDHVTDRYADLAILLGLGLAPGVDLRLTILAVSGVLLTSYMGTQAQALGLGRDYRGLMGRADRLVLLGLVPVAQAAVPGFAPFGLGLLAWLLAFIGAMGHLTALQRFLAGWQELRRRGDKGP